MGKRKKRERAMIGLWVKDVAVHYVMTKKPHPGTSHRIRHWMWLKLKHVVPKGKPLNAPRRVQGGRTHVPPTAFCSPFLHLYPIPPPTHLTTVWYQHINSYPPCRHQHKDGGVVPPKIQLHRPVLHLDRSPLAARLFKPPLVPQDV